MDKIKELEKNIQFLKKELLQKEKELKEKYNINFLELQKIEELCAKWGALQKTISIINNL